MSDFAILFGALVALFVAIVQISVQLGQILDHLKRLTGDK